MNSKQPNTGSLEFLLKNNRCLFGKKLNIQLLGRAMEASFASFYAWLTIGYSEETILFRKLNINYTKYDASTIDLQTWHTV